jgi:hypothetical protein
MDTDKHGSKLMVRRVTPCAPGRGQPHDGAHGVTRPTQVAYHADNSEKHRSPVDKQANDAYTKTMKAELNRKIAVE